jgi:hypothetical protein
LCLAACKSVLFALLRVLAHALRWARWLLHQWRTYLPLLKAIGLGPSSLGIKGLVTVAGALLAAGVAVGFGPAVVQTGGAVLHFGICRGLCPSCFPASWMGKSN